MITFFDETLQKSVSIIAESHAMLAEKMSRIDELGDKLDDLTGAMVALEVDIRKNTSNIVEIEKAQG